MTTARKTKLRYCPVCKGNTAHEVVARWYVQSAGRLPGVKWSESKRREVARCLKCKHEGPPPGEYCEVCYGTSFRTLFTRKKVPGMTSRMRECKLCGTAQRQVTRKARG